MNHLIAAEDYERAAATIAEHGGAWVTAGAFTSLVAFVDALPQPALEAHPRVLAHRAEVARLQDDFNTAQSLLRRAATLLNEQGDREGEAEALHSLATIARRRRECEQAFAYLDRAERLAGENSPVRARCGNTRGLCLVALGEWKEAEREFRTALQLTEEQGDERYARFIAHNLGTPAGLRGDFGEAMRWLRRLLREDDSNAPPTPQEATAYLNMARCFWYKGDLAACERHLEQALERCQLFNLSALRGEIFETYGNLYRERGDAARAAEYYERAARAYDETGIEVTQRELLEEQALLNLQLGNLPTARAMMDRLVAAREAAGDERGRHTAMLTRGRILLAEGQHEPAFADLSPSHKFFRAQNLYFYEAQASLALAACEQARRHEVEMLEHLRRALDLAARYDYEYWLAREVAQNPRLFASSDAMELLPAEIREQLPAALQAAVEHAPAAAQGRAGGSEPSVQRAVSARPAVDLTISMLGAVEIYRDPQRPLAADAWTTKRARDILCFIASRRHRRASKDTIIDTFWGEADFEAVEKNFHPTVSHIRKALNSNQPLKQNFLLYRDGDYMLNPEFSYRIDTEEFDRLLTEGEAARRARQQEAYVAAYEQAIALYRGEFMQGSYDDWVEEQRSYYSEQYLRMLETLAATAQKAEEWPRSIDLAQSILRADPFREDVHCMLMRAHAALGLRAAVREQYETLRRLLRKELGVEPAAETQRIYKEMMR